MSESYVINEKRELILDRVKEFIYQNGGVVKKSQLNELGIDYRRILDFVEKGDLIRIKNGYYAVRLSDFSEEELMLSSVGANTVLAIRSQKRQNTAPPKKHAGITRSGLAVLSRLFTI